MVRPHLELFLTGPRQDEVWQRELNMAQSRQHSGGRLGRAWMFFQPVPAKVLLPLPRLESISTSHRLAMRAVDPHRRRPQQHRAVERFERRGAVAGALRGDPHRAGAGAPDRPGHVGGRLGLYDNRGPLVHGQVPCLARLVVAGLARDENLARDSRPQGFQVAVGTGVLFSRARLPR
jgi:hypothetical protein